jgi:hypothetical protein
MSVACVRILGKLRAATFRLRLRLTIVHRGPSQMGADTSSLTRSWRPFKRREPAFACCSQSPKKQGCSSRTAARSEWRISPQRLGVPREPGPRNSSPAHAGRKRRPATIIRGYAALPSPERVWQRPLISKETRRRHQSNSLLWASSPRPLPTTTAPLAAKGARQRGPRSPSWSHRGLKEDGDLQGKCRRVWVSVPFWGAMDSSACVGVRERALGGRPGRPRLAGPRRRGATWLALRDDEGDPAHGRRVLGSARLLTPRRRRGARDVPGQPGHLRARLQPSPVSRCSSGTGSVGSAFSFASTKRHPKRPALPRCSR